MRQKLTIFGWPVLRSSELLVQQLCFKFFKQATTSITSKKSTETRFSTGANLMVTWVVWSSAAWPSHRKLLWETIATQFLGCKGVTCLTGLWWSSQSITSLWFTLSDMISRDTCLFKARWSTESPATWQQVGHNNPQVAALQILSRYPRLLQASGPQWPLSKRNEARITGAWTVRKHRVGNGFVSFYGFCMFEPGHLSPISSEPWRCFERCAGVSLKWYEVSNVLMMEGTVKRGQKSSEKERVTSCRWGFGRSWRSRRKLMMLREMDCSVEDKGDRRAVVESEGNVVMLLLLRSAKAKGKIRHKQYWNKERGLPDWRWEAKEG